MELKHILVITEDMSFYTMFRDKMLASDIDILLVLPFSKALSSYMTYEYCLAVLDWQLVGEHGMKILQTMRAARSIPILMLIDKEDNMRKVSLYEAGVNAFLEKPIDIDICAAQAKALIQLYLDTAIDHSSLYPLVIERELVINPQYRQVTLKGEQITLTRKEFDLLYFLARHSGQVLSTKQLYGQIWGDNLDCGGDETVRVHIKTLRKKLGGDGKKYIQNVWGVGYKFLL